MKSALRKFILTSHITFSVGWLGAVIAYLSLAVKGLSANSIQELTGIYPSLETIGWYAIVPCAGMALLTGLVQALGGHWGLFRHYWVLVKFLLTFGASIILVKHMSSSVSVMAEAVTEKPEPASMHEQMMRLNSGTTGATSQGHSPSMHGPEMHNISGAFSEGTFPHGNFQMMQKSLTIHAAGGLLILIITTILSVYKPWGMTPYGKKLKKPANVK